MSAELVVISWPSSPKGEQFGAGVKVQGEYFEAGSQSPGRVVTGAPTDHPLYQALKKVGIEPYSPHSEDELRAALIAMGLDQEEIDKKFQSAREYKTTITVRQ